MLVVNRFRVPAGGGDDRAAVTAADDFRARAQTALTALAACPGFAGGQLGRSADDPSWWCLATRWDSVGSYRRALGSYQVKVAATPLLADAVAEPTAYEVLTDVGADGHVRTAASDRAPDADWSGPGQGPGGS